MSRNATASIIIVLLILLGGFFYFQSHSVVTSVIAPDETTAPTTKSVSSNEIPNNQNLVTISASGFSPTTVTIKEGESVSWINSDTKNHQVESNPTYTNYPAFSSIDLLVPGQQKSLQFPTSGTYYYHDSLNPQLTGIIVVQ